MGEKDVPLSLGKGVVENLRELRERLGNAERYASEHADKRQTQYTTCYNLRNQDKTFNVREQVLILIPDSTSSKTFKGWQGPATITVKKLPHSYIVELNGSKHKIHAKQLRKFYCRAYKVSRNVTLSITASCNSAITNEKNLDFSLPETTSMNTNNKLLSKRIEESKLAHLEPQQRAELLSLLGQVCRVFFVRSRVLSII